MINEPKVEVTRVEQILLNLLDTSSLDRIFSLVDREKVDILDDREYTSASTSRVSLLVDMISQYALLDKHVYHA